jgi:hypothetical protein
MIFVIVIVAFLGSFVEKDGFEAGSLSAVDAVYYINLDHRTDRKDEFLSEISKVRIPNEKIVRIPGVYIKARGDLGCSKSHIETLKQFIDSGYDRCIVFEDDFQFIEKHPNLEPYFQKLEKAQKENGLTWDVILFAACEADSESTEYPFLTKMNNAQTTAGYMMSKNYAPTLLANFEEGAKLLEESYNAGKPNPSEYAVDQYWKRLQKTGQWFRFEPKIGKQRKSYSDIQKGVVDAGV